MATEKKPHYEILAKQGIIRFDEDKITVAEMKKIKRLAKGFGYELVPYSNKQVNKAYTQEAIQEFLQDKPEPLAIYEKRYNAPMVDKETKEPKLYKNDSKDGKHKAGEPRIKGHVATLQWFKSRFPKYPDSDEESAEQVKKDKEWLKKNK